MAERRRHPQPCARRTRLQNRRSVATSWPVGDRSQGDRDQCSSGDRSPGLSGAALGSLPGALIGLSEQASRRQRWEETLVGSRVDIWEVPLGRGGEGPQDHEGANISCADPPRPDDLCRGQVGPFLSTGYPVASSTNASKETCPQLAVRSSIGTSSAAEGDASISSSALRNVPAANIAPAAR